MNRHNSLRRRLDDRFARVLAGLILALALVAGSTGCSRPATEAPNVVLIVLDTMRAKNWPTYGYDRNTTPFLASLESSSVVFDNAFSTSSWTAPSTASIHTSLYPFQHGVMHGYFISKGLGLELNRIPEEATTIASTLADAGYTTYAVADNVNISRAIGFDRGFDHFERFPYKEESDMEDRLASWAASMGDDPYFLYIHYNDAHAPWHEREPWYERQDDPRADTLAKYDSEIHHVDAKIRRMHDLFGWDRDTLIVVVADHGEEFWEHGQVGHGYSLFAEVTRIPLFMRFPGKEPGARRIEPSVSSIDILPTIASYLGIEVDADVAGADLMPLVRNEARSASEEDRFLFSHLVFGEKNPRAPEGFDETIIKSVVWGKWHLIFRQDARTGEVSEPLLFDRSIDPDEASNVYSLFAPTANRMLAAFYNFERTCPKFTSTTRDVELDPERVEELRRLGYVK